MRSVDVIHTEPLCAGLKGRSNPHAIYYMEEFAPCNVPVINECLLSTYDSSCR